LAQLFDDEVLSVVLKFSNPNKRDMEDADKIATKLSMALDGVVRKSVFAGRAVADVLEGIKRLEPTLKSMEKRAGTIGASAGALKTAQQILARYTPARLEKLAEVQASKIAETSGTASLRRQLEKHGELIKRLVATREGRYNRATGNSPTGRGLFIDTESTGLNALKHQITELTATLFTFNKATGEILNQQERTYHGFQQLAFQSRHQYMPQGVTPAQLQSQAISTTMLRRLMQQADFVVAHNAPHDKKFVERLVPQAAGMMWLDSMRGIPWRTLGHSSRAQQDLLRAHGINPGQAHRATDDVRAGVKLLSSRSPIGGPTYMSMLLGNQGPLNQSQQLLAQIKHMADEIRSDLSSRLGEGGGRYMSSTARYKSLGTTASRAADDVAEFYTQHVIAAIEGGIDARSRRPARSTDYGIKFGSGQAPETTPGLLGHSAISIDRRLGVIDQFLRNMTIMSGPASSSQFMDHYVFQSRSQERIQQGRGRGRQIKSDIRSGDEVSLATMQGLNTRYENERQGIQREDPMNALLNELDRRQSDNRTQLAQRMLSQPWAQPPKKSVYIAGPMRGIPNLNFPEFDRTEALWRGRGFGVVNPAQLDREHGYIPVGGQTHFANLSIEEAMSRDIPAVTGTSGIALMRGWEKSQGAKMELQHAISQRKEIYDAESGNRLRLRDLRALGMENLSMSIQSRIPVSSVKNFSPTIFRDREIATFIDQNSKSASPSLIRHAAQMASHVGPNDPRFMQLASIMFEGQQVGRQLASSRAVQAQKEAMDRIAGNVGSKPRSGFRNVIGEALRGLSDAGLATGMTAVSPFLSSGGIGGGSFGTFLNYFRNRRRSASSGGRTTSYDERAEGYLPEPTTLRGSMRRDALEQKLGKLRDTVESTTRGFQTFRDVTAQAKANDAARRYSSRDYAITSGLNSARGSFDAQLARLEGRRLQSRTSTSRRLGGIQESFESRSSALGFSELDAEQQYESALDSQRRKTARLRKSKAYSKGKLSDEDIQAGLQGPVRSAQMRLIKAEYQARASQLTDPGEIDSLRRQTAGRYAVARYGPGSGPELEQLRSDYAERVHGLLGGRTLAQRAEGRARQVGEDQVARERELDQAVDQIRARRDSAEASASQKRSDNASRFGAEGVKLESEVEKRRLASLKKITDAEKKAHEARVRYLKTEDAAGGGGGGGGSTHSGGTHGGGSGRSNFESRDALGFGLGLSTLASYGVAIWNGVKESAIYAANVDALKFSTQEIAKVNALDVGAVMDSVNNIKKLNMTTESANQVVQRMIFAQLDVGKAGQVAQVAQNVSILSGQTPAEAVERIITGVSTGLTVTLHRMGLPVSMLQVNRQLSADRKAEGKSGPASEVEKRQALLNAVIREGAKANGLYEKSLLTAGGQLKLFEQNMQELQYSVGKEFLPEFGRFISLMSSGAKFVDANSASVAKFASVLASLTAAASSVGTLALFRYLLASPVVPWWAKLIGAGVGVATYSALNQDDAVAMSKTANEQLDALKGKIDSLKKERSSLQGSKNDSPEWKNAMDINTEATRSASEAQVSINQELTKNLADEYNKRIADIDNYIAAMEGKQGTWAQIMATFRTSPENSAVGAVARDIPILGNTGPEDIEEARQQRAGLAGQFASGTRGITAEDIKREAVRQRLERLRVADLSPSIINKEKLAVASMISEMTDAEGQLNKLDEKYSEEGTVGLRARKAMGSPRQKVLLDYDEQVAKVNKLSASLTDLKKNAADGDVGAQTQLNDVAKQLGGGDFILGHEKINDFLSRKDDVVGAAAEDRDIQLGKINRQNKAQIAQVREQMQVEQVQSAVVQGNYSSEREAILKTFDIKQQTAKKTLGLLEDVDAYNRQIAQNETDRDVGLLRLEIEKKRAQQDRDQRVLSHGADLKAQDILDSPGDAEQVIRYAYRTKLDATASITDENKRLNDQLDLLFELDEALRKLSKDKKTLAAEGRISEFQDNQQLAMEIDRTISAQAGKRQSTTHRALAEIERTREGEIAIANKTFDERQPITAAVDQAALAQQRDQSIRQANVKAAVDSIKTVEQEIDTARERLAKTLEQRGSNVQEAMQSMAISQNEELAAAENIHRIRLEYIEAEYKARGQTLEAEEQKEEEIRQVEMDKLKQMLDLRKQQMEGIRSFSEGLFNTLVTDHARGLRDFMMGQVKGIGAKVFGNLAVDTLKGVHTNLPGLETTDAQGNKKLTFLGRMLSGTSLGRKVPTDQDINAQIKKVNEANTKATDKNTDAIDKLTETLEQILQSLGVTPGTSPSSTGGASGGFRGIPSGHMFNLGPLFGGSGSGSPFAFNPGGNSATPFSLPLLPSLGSSGVRPGAVDTSIDFGDGSGPTNKSTTYYGLDQAGNPVTGGPGSGVGVSQTTIPSAEQPAGAPSGNGSAAPIPSKSDPLSGIPNLGNAVSGAMSGLKKLNSNAGTYVAGGLEALTGAYQAITNFSKAGVRSKSFGVAGALTSAAGITSMIPGAQVATPFLELGALGADLFGSFFQDPKQKRSNQIANYLAANAYMAPAQLDVTSTLQGNLAAEGKGGTVTDTGITANSIKVTAPSIEVINPNSFLSSILPSGKPTINGYLGQGQGTISADDFSGQQLTYAQIPGQVSYAGLPGVANNPVSIHVSAMDSQSFLDRSADITAAVQKELSLGNGVAQQMQNSIFGTG
jgi:DNA polymerase III epsilon subunit-like protein